MSLARPFIAGASLKKLEIEKGVIARFVIGRRFGFGLSLFHLSTTLNLDDDYMILDSCFETLFLSYVVQIKGTAWTRALMLKIVKPMTSLFSYVFFFTLCILLP